MSRRVGIIGGGQLGLMLAQSVTELGASVGIFDPDPHAPAQRAAARVVHASFSDVAALEAFFADHDVVTYEFENLDATALGAVTSATPLWPSVNVLRTAQDRAAEKQFLVANSAPVVRHAVAHTASERAAAAAAVGYPQIAKTARGGYDGKGQVSLRSEQDLAQLDDVPGGWVFEARVEISRELSCIVARGRDGEERVFPLFENVHRDHILDTTIVPARIDTALAQDAADVAQRLARALDVIGLLTVEFFVTPEGLVVNELAPRPHNSGHVTRRATRFSQFDALARVLCEVPIGQPALHGPGAYAMGNLLGDVWPAGSADLSLAPWARFPTVSEVYLYGKREPKPKRKMGHFLVEESTADAAERTVREFREALRG